MRVHPGNFHCNIRDFSIIYEGKIIPWYTGEFYPLYLVTPPTFTHIEGNLTSGQQSEKMMGMDFKIERSPAFRCFRVCSAAASPCLCTQLFVVHQINPQHLRLFCPCPFIMYYIWLLQWRPLVLIKQFSFYVNTYDFDVLKAIFQFSFLWVQYQNIFYWEVMPPPVQFSNNYVHQETIIICTSTGA